MVAVENLTFINNTHKKEQSMGTFVQEFFAVYDRKTALGEIKFNQIGITKEDFTKLCTDENFRFGREKLADICAKMKLTEEETNALFEASK